MELKELLQHPRVQFFLDELDILHTTNPLNELFVLIAKPYAEQAKKTLELLVSVETEGVLEKALTHLQTVYEITQFSPKLGLSANSALLPYLDYLQNDEIRQRYVRVLRALDSQSTFDDPADTDRVKVHAESEDGTITLIESVHFDEQFRLGASSAFVTGIFPHLNHPACIHIDQTLDYLTSVIGEHTSTFVSFQAADLLVCLDDMQTHADRFPAVYRELIQKLRPVIGTERNFTNVMGFVLYQRDLIDPTLRKTYYEILERAAQMGVSNLSSIALHALPQLRLFRDTNKRDLYLRMVATVEGIDSHAANFTTCHLPYHIDKFSDPVCVEAYVEMVTANSWMGERKDIAEYTASGILPCIETFTDAQKRKKYFDLLNTIYHATQAEASWNQRAEVAQNAAVAIPAVFDNILQPEKREFYLQLITRTKYRRLVASFAPLHIDILMTGENGNLYLELLNEVEPLDRLDNHCVRQSIAKHSPNYLDCLQDPRKKSTFLDFVYRIGKISPGIIDTVIEGSLPFLRTLSSDDLRKVFAKIKATMFRNVPPDELSDWFNNGYLAVCKEGAATGFFDFKMKEGITVGRARSDTVRAFSGGNASETTRRPHYRRKIPGTDVSLATGFTHLYTHGITSFLRPQQSFLTAKVSSLSALMPDPVELTKCFAYAILAQNGSKWYMRAREIFGDKVEIISQFRGYDAGKFLSKIENIYGDFCCGKGSLFDRIDRMDLPAAESIVRKLSRLYEKGEKIDYMHSITELEATFMDHEAFDSVHVESSPYSVTPNIFDHVRTFNCGFGPRGANREACIGWGIDSNIGSIDLVPYRDGTQLSRIGSAIVVNSEYDHTPDTWVIDSVEVGLDIERIPITWQQIYFKGIVNAAHKYGKRRILFNSHVSSPNAKTFNRYFVKRNKRKQHHLSAHAITLIDEMDCIEAINVDFDCEVTKIGGVVDITTAGYGNKLYLEAWGEKNKHTDWNSGGNGNTENRRVKGFEVLLTRSSKE